MMATRGAGPGPLCSVVLCDCSCSLRAVAVENDRRAVENSAIRVILRAWWQAVGESESLTGRAQLRKSHAEFIPPSSAEVKQLMLDHARTFPHLPRLPAVAARI